MTLYIYRYNSADSKFASLKIKKLNHQTITPNHPPNKTPSSKSSSKQTAAIVFDPSEPPNQPQKAVIIITQLQSGVPHVNTGRFPFVLHAATTINDVVSGSAVAANHRQLKLPDDRRDTFESVATAIINFTASVVATVATELSATAGGATHFNNVSSSSSSATTSSSLSSIISINNAFSSTISPSSAHHHHSASTTVSSAHHHHHHQQHHHDHHEEAQEYAEMPQIPAYIRTTSMVLCITIMILGVIGNIMVSQCVVWEIENAAWS